MRAAYTIFPHSGYILETFRGAVTYQDIVRFTTRQQNDPRVLNHYRTVSDYVQATLRMTENEVSLYGNAIYATSAARSGKHALVVVGARNLAVASLLESCAAQSGIELHSFRYREAALRWIDVPQVATATRSNTQVNYVNPQAESPTLP